MNLALQSIRSTQLFSRQKIASTRLSALSTHLSQRSLLNIRTMASLPKTMKAVYIEQTGDFEVLQYKDVPVPEPKEGEVLVKNEFIGINYIDT